MFEAINHAGTIRMKDYPKNKQDKVFEITEDSARILVDAPFESSKSAYVKFQTSSYYILNVEK